MLEIKAISSTESKCWQCWALKEPLEFNLRGCGMSRKVVWRALWGRRWVRELIGGNPPSLVLWQIVWPLSSEIKLIPWEMMSSAHFVLLPNITQEPVTQRNPHAPLPLSFIWNPEYSSFCHSVIVYLSIAVLKIVAKSSFKKVISIDQLKILLVLNKYSYIEYTQPFSRLHHLNTNIGYKQYSLLVCSAFILTGTGIEP